MLGYTQKEIEEMIDGLLNVHSTLNHLDEDAQQVWLAADFFVGLIEEGRI
jgi:hypothetical protein